MERGDPKMSTQRSNPQTVKRLLCLANSRKLSGRCIAGREIVANQPSAWVRPVSDREHQEVSERERQYQDGSDPQVLDIIDIPLVRHTPHTFQQENWLLDPNFYWVKRGLCDWPRLQEFVEPDGRLWINNESSSNGINDRVLLFRAQQLRTSLRLIHIGELRIEVFAPGAAYGNPKRRVQGRFRHEGTDHWLWITDPIYERRYLAKADGHYTLGECCLTISLGEAHEGFCYKLIAAVIERAQNE